MDVDLDIFFQYLNLISIRLRIISYAPKAIGLCHVTLRVIYAPPVHIHSGEPV